MTVRGSAGATSGKKRPGWRTKAVCRLRPGALGIILLGATVALAACGSPRSLNGGASSPTVAALGTRGSTSAGRTTTTERKGATTTTDAGPGTSGGSTTATQLADAWASCMRRHGDPNQADPTIDTHGVINIGIGAGTSQALANQVRGGVDQQTGTCSQFLSEAQLVLRQEFPVSPPPDNPALLEYAACMRTNGVPNYPDPTGEKADLSGIDINSPTFLKANDICGKKVHAPAWWIDGWGPPGDVSVRSCFSGNQTIACPKGSPPAGGSPGAVGSNG